MPTMEEIGYRTAVFSLDSIGGCQAEYIQWLLEKCVAEGKEISELVVPEAIDLLAQKLRTPLTSEYQIFI
jgi:type II secretory pathway predicted ATPase ExeA